MTLMTGLAAGLAGGLTGYMRGQQMARDKERDDKEQAYRDEQRAFMRDQQQRQRKDWADQDAVSAAAMPTAVTMVGGKPNTMDNIDVGAPGETQVQPVSYAAAGQSFATKPEADTAAAQYNAPIAGFGRMRDEAMKRGKAEMTQHLQGFVDNLKKEGAIKFLDANPIAPNVTVEDIKAGKYKNVPLQGVDEANTVGEFRLPKGAYAEYVVDDLGRPDFIVRAADGSQVGNFSAGGLSRAYDRANYLLGRKERIGQMDKEADNKRLSDAQVSQDQRWRDQLDELKRHNQAVEAATRQREARIGAGQTPAEAPVWDKDADKMLVGQYTAVDPDAGTKKLDGEGFQFAKQIALARSHGTGGDSTSAIAFAVQKDEELQALAKGDRMKLRGLRSAYLSRLMGSGQPADAAPTNDKPPAPPPAAAPSIRDAGQPAQAPRAPAVTYMRSQKDAIQEVPPAPRSGRTTPTYIYQGQKYDTMDEAKKVRGY